jgi:hypothetical protein
MKKNPEMFEKFKAFVESEKEKKRRESMENQSMLDLLNNSLKRERKRSTSRSPTRSGRRLSPLSQRGVQLVNPQALLAAPPGLAPDITKPALLANVDSLLVPPGVSPPRGSGIEAKLVMENFANFVPAGPSAISRQQSHKSERDLELERKMAEFVKKNDSKDIIHEDLPKRKKRTFTDYPVYDDRQQKWPSSVVDAPPGVEVPPIGIHILH